MTYLFTLRLAKIFLLILLCSSFVFTQPYLSCINWKGEFYNNIETKIVSFIVKDGYYNDELLEKLKNPPYFPTYSYGWTMFIGMEYHIYLTIAGDPEDINLLDHLSKFEKEEFVKEALPYGSDVIIPRPDSSCYDVKGHVLKNGVPLANHIINLRYTQGGYVYNSISDENGNYIFHNMIKTVTYTLSLKDEGITYGTTFVLDENKVINFNDGILVGIDYSEEIPSNYSLSQNYPNPFNPSTNFSYSVPNKTDVRIAVYDLFGREIKTLINESKDAGTYNITWNGRDNNNRQVSTGVYFYKMQAGGFQKTMKMMLMK